MKSQSHIVELTSEIVSAYVANNASGAQDIPTLIEPVHVAMTTLDVQPAPIEDEKPDSAVPVEK
jgi:predicted transcriptional regulator